MIYDTAIYGGWDDPQIVYVDRVVEKIIRRGGGGGGGGGTQFKEVEKIIYKDPVFPILKIRKIESHNRRRIQITITNITNEDI